MTWSTRGWSVASSSTRSTATRGAVTRRPASRRRASIESSVTAATLPVASWTRSVLSDPRPTGKNGAVHAGQQDLERAADALAARIPWPLAPLARVAYNYRWAWLEDGSSVFRDVDHRRWRLCGGNPVRL